MPGRIVACSLLAILIVPQLLVSQTTSPSYATMPGVSGADALDVLATRAVATGDIQEAFWLEEEALAIVAQRLPPTDFQRVRFLLRHGEYAARLGLSDLSHSSYQQAVDLYGTSRVDDGLIRALVSLAETDESRGMLDEARGHAERAVRACEANCRGNAAVGLKQRAHQKLASVLYHLEQLDAADAELTEAIRAGGSAGLTPAIANQRAEILAARGQLVSALHMLLKVPRAARDTNALARVQARLGDVPAAIATLRESFEQSFNEIGRLLPQDGPARESALIQAAANLPGRLGTAVALDEAFGDANFELRELVATMVLNRVGLASDLVTDMYLRLRRGPSPQDAQQLREMFRLRSQAALWARHHTLQRPNAEAQVREFSRRARAIEISLLKRRADAVGDFKMLLLDTAARALSPDTALVQIVKFAPPAGSPKYRAYIVRRHRLEESPQFTFEAVTLGDARAIDRVVEDFRKALMPPEGTHPDVRRQLARDAGALIWDELGMRLPGANVIMVPDAGLLSLSFEALRGRDGQFVGQTKAVTYLASARELDYDVSADLTIVGNGGRGPNFSADQPSSPPFVLANPAFGPPNPSAAHWDALPGTSEDADEITKSYATAVVRKGPEASRAVLKNVVSPSFLHIGSHAFYADTSARSVDALVDSAVGPMIAGGVVLAGANTPGVEDDGIASPVDFAGLDLRGTELVFVSGCSSGSGSLRDGEGLYGMRRALRIAGSRSQILALWDVDRDATSQFVRAFYSAWSKKVNIETAFKTAQRQVREGWEGDPYYWAAFTLSGTPFR